MRQMVMGCVFVLCTAASAQAVTVRDILDLTKAGLGEDVLLALIEIDERVFPIDAETLTQLKSAGVSQRVIVALIRSGRGRPAAPEAVPQAAEPPAPQVIYLAQPGPTVVREVAVPVPFYIAVPSWRGTRRGQPSQPGAGQIQPSITAPELIHGPQRYLTDTPLPPKTEPVYWGWGGKLRPDAWKPK